MPDDPKDQKAYRDQEIIRAYDRERKRILAEREAARKDPRQIAMGGLDPGLNAQLEGSVPVIHPDAQAAIDATLGRAENALRAEIDANPSNASSEALMDELEQEAEEVSCDLDAPLKKPRGFPWLAEGISRAEWLKRKEQKDD